MRVLSQDPTQATYFIPEGWDLSDALERLPAAKDLDEFFNLLADAGLQVETRTLPSGDLGGYKVALPDDGTPIWFSGSSLATDLSLPQIRQRLAATETQPTPASSTRHHRPNPWHVATAATERIPTTSPTPTTGPSRPT